MSTILDNAELSDSTMTKDKQHVIAHAAMKNAQAFSMLAPPLYLVINLFRRRPLSIGRLMRVSTMSVAGGAGIGAGLGWYMMRNESVEAMEDRVFRLKHNVTQIRTDDYSVIGASLGALIIPGIFLRRMRLPGLVLGGASIGLGAGVWVHLIRSLTEGQDTRPEGMVGEIPVVGGNDKK